MKQIVSIFTILIIGLHGVAGADLAFETLIPDRTIIIDGLSDDWDGVSPFYTDSSGDNLCGSGSDITSIFLAKDSEYLYWRVDTQSGTYAIGTSENRMFPILNFYERTGSPNPNGITTNFTFPSDSPPEVFLSEKTNNIDWVGLPDQSGIDAGTINDIAEGRISLSLFNQFNIDHLMVYYYSPSQSCDDSDYFFIIPAPITAVDFSSWDQNTDEGDVAFTPSETTLQFNASGTSGFAWGNISKQFSNAIGLLATVNVSSSSTNISNDIGIGLRKNIGHTASGNTIQALMYLMEYDNDRKITFRVRERTPDYTTVRWYTKGTFGDYYGGWDQNTDYTIGMVSIGQNIAFYASDLGGFTTFQLMEPITPAPTEQVEVFTYAGTNGPDQISGTVNNAYVLTTSNLMDFSTIGLIPGDANLDGKIGIEDVINALRVLTGDD